MAKVVFPLVKDARNNVVPCVVRIALVDALGQRRVGWRTATGEPVVEVLTRRLDGGSAAAINDGKLGFVLDLLPQSQLGLPGGMATFYEIAIDVGGGTQEEPYRVQVPDSPPIVNLMDLIGAAAVDPADILAGRLLPDPATIADGWSLSVVDGLPAWVSVPPGSGVPEAPLSGGPYGRQGGAWVTAVGPQGPQGIQGLKGDKGDAGSPGDAGLSAYQVAVAGGFSGTQAQWLASLVGSQGVPGVQGVQGPKGDAGNPGTAGSNGLSAYQIAVAAGFNGTESQWLASLTGPQGSPGVQGPAGSNGTAATVTVGTVSTGAAGSSATVVNAGTSSAAVLNFSIPQGAAGAQGLQGIQGVQGVKGDTGAAGAAATVAIGTVTTGAAGSSATVTNSGTSTNAVFDFTIPRGDAGTGGSGSTAYARRHEYAAPYDYLGKAPAGTADSATGWTIIRLNLNGSTLVDTKTGTGSWTNRASVTYA